MPDSQVIHEQLNLTKRAFILTTISEAGHGPRVSIYFMFTIYIVMLLSSLFGMFIFRTILLKFFLFYELFFFILSVILLSLSSSINIIIIVLFLLFNSVLEMVLALSYLVL